VAPEDAGPTWADARGAQGVLVGAGGRQTNFFGDHATVLDIAAVPGPEQVEAAQLWRLPHLRSPAFVGREEILDRLHETFAGQRSGLAGQCVAGLGGVGKSEVAAQYAWTYRHEYPRGVWWIAADDTTALSAGLAALARNVCPAWRMLPDEPAAEWALTWLRHWPGWLLVLDDVPVPQGPGFSAPSVGPGAGGGGVPQGPGFSAPSVGPGAGRSRAPGALTEVLAELGGATGGHVLMTSRRDVAWDDLGLTLLRLGPLDPDAAVRLLLARTGQHDEPAAEGIVAELGRLPLALEQAAAYVKHHVIALDRYLRQLRAQPERLFAAVAPERSAERAIARIWDLTLAALTAADPDAVRLLAVLSWFASEDVPRDLVTALIGDELDADRLLGLLTSYSMAGVTSDAVSVHRLVQAVARTGGPAYESAIALLGDVLPADPLREVAGWPRWRRLLPHITALAAGAAPDARVGLLLNEAGYFELVQGHNDAALHILSKALEITEAASGADHRDTAIRLSNLACAYHAVGRSVEAADLLRRALRINTTELGPEHRSTAVCLSGLGTVECDLGNPAEALALHQQVLRIAEAGAEPDGYLVAHTLLNINACYRELGRPADALAALHLPSDSDTRNGVAARPTSAALSLLEEALDANHPEIARRLGTVASTYRALGRPGDALPLELRALRIAETAFGSDHPSVFARLDQLGVTYVELGRPRDALPLFERALAGIETGSGDGGRLLTRVLGNLAATRFHLDQVTAAAALLERAVAIADLDDYDTAHLLNKLAVVYERQGRTADAVPLQREALRIMEAVRGPDHPDVAISLGHVAAGYHALGDLDEAVAHQQRALRITRTALGKRHPRVADCLVELAGSYRALARNQDAVRLETRALAIREEALGPGHPSLADLLTTLAIDHDAHGDPDQALAMFHRAVKITEDALGPDHAAVAVPLSCAAATYHRLGRRAEALTAARRAAEIADRSQPPGNPTSTAMRNLIAGRTEPPRARTRKGNA